VGGDPPASAEEAQRVGERADLGQAGRGHDDARAWFEPEAEHPPDFRLGADVRVDLQLVGDEEPRAVKEPLAVSRAETLVSLL